MTTFTLNTIKKISPFWILTTILSAFFLTFSLVRNEEQYLQYAKQFFNPDWIPNDFSLNEFAGARLIFQYIFGFLLHYFSFEAVAFWGKLAIIILISMPLAKIYKTLALDNFQLLLHLVIFFLPQQAFFAQSRIFIGVETKTIAYIFVFWGLYFFIKRKFRYTLIFLILTTYFHILVGGILTALFLLTIWLFKHQSLKQTFIIGLLYFLATLPFIGYLYQGFFLSNVENTTPSIDWIYTYFRNPHHTAIFKNLKFFFDEHLLGVGYVCFALLLSLSLFQKIDNPSIKSLNQLNLVILTVSLLAVFVAFFDKEGRFLKFYPFRLVTLGTFLFYLILIHFFFQEIIQKQYIEKLYFFVLLPLLLIFSIKPLAYNFVLNYRVLLAPKDDFTLICEQVQKNVPKNEAVLCLDAEDDKKVFTRKTERARLAIFKFVPAGTHRVYQWYQRILDKRKALEKPEYILKIKDKYKINYLLTDQEVMLTELKLLAKNQTFFLYAIQ